MLEGQLPHPGLSDMFLLVLCCWCGVDVLPVPEEILDDGVGLMLESSGDSLDDDSEIFSEADQCRKVKVSIQAGKSHFRPTSHFQGSPASPKCSKSKVHNNEPVIQMTTNIWLDVIMLTVWFTSGSSLWFTEQCAAPSVIWRCPLSAPYSAPSATNSLTLGWRIK